MVDYLSLIKAVFSALIPIYAEAFRCVLSDKQASIRPVI